MTQVQQCICLDKVKSQVWLLQGSALEYGASRHKKGHYNSQSKHKSMPIQIFLSWDVLANKWFEPCLQVLGFTQELVQRAGL